jgi:hypothetical protein
MDGIHTVGHPPFHLREGDAQPALLVNKPAMGVEDDRNDAAPCAVTKAGKCVAKMASTFFLVVANAPVEDSLPPLRLTTCGRRVSSSLPDNGGCRLAGPVGLVELDGDMTPFLSQLPGGQNLLGQPFFPARPSDCAAPALLRRYCPVTAQFLPSYCPVPARSVRPHTLTGRRIGCILQAQTDAAGVAMTTGTDPGSSNPGHRGHQVSLTVLAEGPFTNGADGPLTTTLRVPVERIGPGPRSARFDVIVRRPGEKPVSLTSALRHRPGWSSTRDHPTP